MYVMLKEAIEDELKLAADGKVSFPGGRGEYKPEQQLLSGCSANVFADGQAITFTELDNDNHCIASLAVNLATNVLANVDCAHSGFVQSRQFPWGLVPDPGVTERWLKCPMMNGAYRYGIRLQIKDQD